MKKMYDETKITSSTRHLLKLQQFESDDDVVSDSVALEKLRGNNTDSGIGIEKDDLIPRDGSSAPKSEKLYHSRFDSARTDSGFESFPSERLCSGDSSTWKMSSDIIQPLSPTEECDILLTASPVESEFYGNIAATTTSLSSTKELEEQLKYLKSNYNNSNLATTSSNTKELEEQLRNLTFNDSQNRTNVINTSTLNCYQETPTTKNASDIIFEDDEGDTILHLAIIHGISDLVIRIIQCIDFAHSEFLNLQNNLLQTPLHLAVITNQPVIVRKLVLAGALIDIRDRRGNTPLHIACERDLYNCALSILKPVTVDEMKGVFGHHYHTYNLELINYEGQTCMHLATLCQDLNLIHLLAISGANVNTQECKSGRTPLHYAIEIQNVEIVKFLAEKYKADLNSRTFAGLTPIQFAYNRNQHIVQVLLHLGAVNIGLPLSDSESDSSSDETTKMDTFMDSEMDQMDFCVNGQPLYKI